MTKTEKKYIDFMHAHPGATTQDIVDVWKLDKSTVSARLSTMYAAGFFRREQVRGSGTRGTAYMYWVKDKEEQPAPRVPLHRTPESMEKYPDKAVVVVPEKEAKPVRGLDLLVDVFVDALAGTIADRLKPLIISKLTESVADMTKEITRAIPKEVKIKLHKVLVCGCLDKQGQMLKQEFKGMLDLDYVTVGDAPDVWKNKARSAEAVFVMADFVSHQHTESIKATGVTPVIHRGGFTILKDRLLALSIN